MSATIAYAPRPGSIADRAWQYLHAHGETAAAPLCEGIDLDDSGSLQASLAIALKHGYIAKRKANGLNYYSVGTGIPPEAEPDTDPPRQRVVPAVNGQVRPLPAPAAAAAPFRVGLFSDGQLRASNGAARSSSSSASRRRSWFGFWIGSAWKTRHSATAAHRTAA